MAKLHAYYVTNTHHELNYIGQNMSETDFFKMMEDYAQSLTLGNVMFDENIQLYNDDHDDDYNDDNDNNTDDDANSNNDDNNSEEEGGYRKINLTEVDPEVLSIEDSINLEHALASTSQLLFSEKDIDHSEKILTLMCLLIKECKCKMRK
jgi:hypothetical protein